MAATSSVTLAVLTGAAAIVSSIGGNLPLRTTALDSTLALAENKIFLTSSNSSIARTTSGEQLGNAPVAVVGVSPGVATITATASDNSAATATLVVTVT